MARGWLLLATLPLLVPAAFGQGYPSQPVRIVITAATGGGMDGLARALSIPLSQIWGQQVLVDNRPGGNTVVGTEFVARATPDGHTLLMSEPALILNMSLYTKLPYDALRDFIPVTGLADVNQGLVVNPSLPVKNVQELIALAKAKPGELSYASTGTGSILHLEMEMLAAMAGVKVTHVPYKGGGPALTDIMGGHVQMMFSSVAAVTPHWKSGKLKLLGFSSAKRLPQYPDVPTVAEAGFKDFEGSAWFGIHAPAATPREAINRIYAGVRDVFADPAFIKRVLEPGGLQPIVSSPERFAEYIKAEAVKWERVIREAKIKLE